MGSEVVSLYIGDGPHQQVFTIHKNLLFGAGAIFEEMFSPKILKPGQKMVLKNEDPIAFKLFVEFLYSRNAPAVTSAMTPGKQAIRVNHLCQLYAFLEKYQVKWEIRNKVMDRIQDGFAVLNMLPQPRMITSVYQHTPLTSPLRKFCAESMVYYLHSPEYVADGVIAELMQQKEFADEFLEGIRQAKAAGQQNLDPRVRHCDKSMSCIECAGDFTMLEGKEGMFPCHFHKHAGLINGAEANDESCYLWKA